MKNIIRIAVITLLVGALVAGSVVWGVTSWQTDFSRFGGDTIMTVEELRDIAARYRDDPRGVSLGSLKEYKCSRERADGDIYKIEFWSNSEFKLCVNVDAEKAIEQMYIFRGDDNEFIDIASESVENIDAFLAWEWPVNHTVDFFRLVNFCRVKYNEEGREHAKRRADELSFKHMTDINFHPLASFDDKSSFDMYIWNCYQFYAYDAEYGKNFRELASKYDQTFFEENLLMLIYIEGIDGSDCKIANATVVNGVARINIEGGDTFLSPIGETVAGFIVVECSKQDTKDIKEFCTF